MAAGAQDAAEPTFDDAELRQAHEAAFAEGEAAGRQEAVASIEKQLLNGLGRLVEQMGVLSDNQTRFQHALTERGVELALKATRKMFPALARRDGLVEIEALLADCLLEAKAEPKILVQVSDALAEPFRERIDALASKAGYQGIVTVLADDTLGPADCRIEWADGGAERVAQHMWREFDSATQRIFSDSEDDTIPEPPREPPEAEPGPAMTAPDAPDLITDPPVEPTEGTTAESTHEPTESDDAATGLGATHETDPPRHPATPS